MAERQEEDLDAAGLIGHSYDSLFAIRKRIRSIQDFVLPFRSGLTYPQIGVALLVIVIQLLSWALIVIPLVQITGSTVNFFVFLGWLFVPAVLAAQNIIKPMPHSKTIGGTVNSWFRARADDTVHRRGYPVAAGPLEHPGPAFHYLRMWEPFPEYRPNGAAATTDPLIEARFVNSGPKVALEPWLDSQIAEHKQQHEAARRARRTRSDIAQTSLAHPTVIIPEDS